MNLLSKENADRWHHLAWWLCIVSMPWFDVINSASIFFLAVLTIFDKGFINRLSRLKEAKWVWPFFAYYFLLIIGLVYTPDVDNGISTLLQKLAFVILPLVTVTGRELDNSTTRFLKFSFVYSCSTVVLISLSVAAVNSFSGTIAGNFDASTTANYNSLHSGAPELWQYFSYIQLLRWAGFHPAYFSMYLVFCLTILFTEKNDNRVEKIFHLILGVILVGFVAMLATRAAIIALILSMIFLISRKQHLPIFQVLMFASIFAFFLWYNPVARFRVMEEPLATTYKVDSSVAQWNSVSYRLLEWKGSLAIIKSHLFFGVGTSGWKSAMNNFYTNFNSSTTGLTYNAHNQFLQTWMENGFMAITAISFCIFGSLFKPKVQASYTAFILIFSIMCMTESILDRQKGIIFFTIFQSLFLGFNNKIE